MSEWSPSDWATVLLAAVPLVMALGLMVFLVVLAAHGGAK